ncbi:MAG: transglutaminase family protein [Oscillospiraceae bacterium]|jgi:transglutaminase-like putative cysteine protease|nr:transglutaminase family protein [Oscillospiraceae bacterium]MDD3260485.1 transglutaminase family protein [Oscillospiraceae bacterium]
MRNLSIYFHTAVSFSAPVTEHYFTLRCIPADGPTQRMTSWSLQLQPAADFLLQRDGFGNRLTVGQLHAPHTSLAYTVRGSVQTDLSVRDCTPPRPVDCCPSPCTAPTNALRTFLAALPLPKDPLARACLLSRAVSDHFLYTPGATDIHTTAGEAFALGKGVCQDYAQVLVALCRLAGLPARYVSGLPEGNGETHAWAEIFCSGAWYGLDPTRRCEADEGYVRLNVGREYADCPIERGVFLGAAQQQQSVYMKVSAASVNADSPESFL